ncbi:MAG: glutathione-disulfide reductase [Rhodospirillales bacterium 20-64-7]|nr:MAG: glutathione-disulfide reductase [Rhodospirillales bacterium 20-64-7]
MDFDLFVIGGGSAGVRCARIAAGHGARVGIAEQKFWGGTCVNIGCVPNWATLLAAKDKEILRLNGIYKRLLDQAGAKIFEAHASFIDPHTLDIGGERVTAERIVIATGGHPTRPDNVPGAELGIVSDDAFYLKEMPRRVAIIGSGYIGVEFAGIFAGLGAETHLIYRQPLPLRGFDEDMRLGLAEAMAAFGVILHKDTVPTSVTEVDGAKHLALSDLSVLEVDLVFFATGRVPNVKNLNLEAAGVAVNEAGAIAVDASLATSVPHIYGIGDVTDRLNLTPVATAEGHAVADSLFGGKPRNVSLENVPTAVFSIPPIATVGLTEAQAARRGPAKIFLTRFTPMRHQITGRVRKTIMKLVVDAESDAVLGAHILGEDAPEMMQGIAVAVIAGAKKADFDRTIGIHPTAAEEFVTLRTQTRVVGEESGPE